MATPGREGKFMKKTTEAYNRATCALDALVKATRQIHHDQVDKYAAAQKNAIRWDYPISDVDYQAKSAQALARNEFKNVKSETFRVVTGAWDDFTRKAAAIRSELEEDLSEAGVMRAKDIDQGALALLNSGVMRARDYQRMAEDYADNPAILALLRQGANKYADSLSSKPQISQNKGDAKEIALARHIAESVKTSGEKELRAFDDLLSTATSLAGVVTGGFRHGKDVYEKTALDRWEEVTAGCIGSEEAGESVEEE